MRRREGRDLPPGGQRLASPYDLDARYGVKRVHGWTGCKVHLTETCEPDLPRLIANVETTDATVDDTDMTKVIHQRPAGRRLAPGEHAVDAGYASADHILAARDDHGITLPGPVGAGTTQASRGDGQEPLLAQAAFAAPPTTARPRPTSPTSCPPPPSTSSAPTPGRTAPRSAPPASPTSPASTSQRDP